MIDLQAKRDQLASLKSDVTFRQEQLERISKSGEFFTYARTIVAVADLAP